MASPRSSIEPLRAALAAMPPGALVPRDWLLEQLTASLSGPQGSPAPAPPTLVDLTIRDLAQVFGKRPSTVRAWAERGDFPGAYKLHGKEWRIPASAVEAFQDRQRMRARPGRGTESGGRLSQWRSVRLRGSARRSESGLDTAAPWPLRGHAED